MNELSMFRLKVQYKSENQTTGEIKKTKAEFLAQCVNYTDAEKLMSRIIETESMNKFEPCTYDIIKAKFEASDIYGTKIMQADSNLTCGLIEHFLRTTVRGYMQSKPSYLVTRKQKKKTSNKSITFQQLM